MHPKKKNKNPVRPTILALWKRKQTKQNKVTLFLEIYSIIPETVWYSSVFVNIIQPLVKMEDCTFKLKKQFLHRPMLISLLIFILHAALVLSDRQSVKRYIRATVRERFRLVPDYAAEAEKT